MHDTPLPHGIRPFLKWPGGKFRLLSLLRSVLPQADCLVEPFVGAGSVFLNLRYPRYWINDSHPDLIPLYETLRTDLSTFLAEAAPLFAPEYNRSESYYQLRSHFNDLAPSLQKAALFLYLNRHGYNGLCRYSAKGAYNVPFGAYQKPYFPEAELQHAAQQIQHSQCTKSDFETVLDAVSRHSVVYCEPPYLPLNTQTSFTQYTGKGFTWEAHTRLAASAKRLQRQGICVVISNHDLPETRSLYQAAQCYSLKVYRSIGNSPQRRIQVPELLAVFAPPVGRVIARTTPPRSTPKRAGNDRTAL